MIYKENGKGRENVICIQNYAKSFDPRRFLIFVFTARVFMCMEVLTVYTKQKLGIYKISLCV